MSNNSGNEKWAWLGLLKWSLAYSDGTSPSPQNPMSAEDKAFLEEVMKDGIIDEGERLKFILQQLVQTLEYYQSLEDNETNSNQEEPPMELNDLLDLLQELRDIVEQIDYARAFMSLKGLGFLLGCIQQGLVFKQQQNDQSLDQNQNQTTNADSKTTIPMEIRQACLGIMATLCQNNPPVQLSFLESGSLQILTQVFDALEQQLQGDESDKLVLNCQAKVVQALSANVRNHQVAEQVWHQVPQSKHVFQRALQPSSTSSAVITLQKRSLFFLKAFLMSDTTTKQRLQDFSSLFGPIVLNFLPTSTTQQQQVPCNDELRDLALEFFIALFSLPEQHRQLVHSLVVEPFGQHLQQCAQENVAALRTRIDNNNDEQEAEYLQMEMQQWDKFLEKLSSIKQQPQQEDTQEETTAPLMLTAEGEGNILPQ